jgi:hypothetical protein
MKQLLKLSCVTAILLAFALSVSAQTISVSATSATISATIGTIAGSITSSNGPISGVTNSTTVTVFYGGADGSQAPLSWARAATYGSAITNNDTFSVVLSNMTPNTIIYYNVRAQDAVGTAWLSASKTLTTSTANVTLSGVFSNLSMGGWTLSIVSNDLKAISGTTTSHWFRSGTGF